MNATYPLYLECGRQIAPQWRTIEQWASPKDERAAAFKTNVEVDGQVRYRSIHCDLREWKEFLCQRV